MDDRLYPATAVDDTVPVLPSATINPPPQPAAPVQHAASMALNWDGWLDSQPKETQERIRGNLNSSPDKELYKRRLTATLWMAEREGWHPQDIGKNFDLAMKGFAEKRGQGEVWKDVSTFYSRIQNDAARERDEQVSLEGIKDDTDEGKALREKSLQNRAYYSAVERDDPADDLTMVKEFSRWQQGAIQSGAFNPANAANYYRQWVAIHQQGREDFKVANAAAQKVYGILARTVTERKVGVGGNDVSLKLRSAADDRRVVGDAVGVMENLTPEQKELAFRQIGVFDARSKKKAGIAGEGVAANMAEGAGRSAVNMIDNATDSAFLKGIRGRVAKEGDNITRSDYNALLDSMGSKEGKLDTGFSFSSKADPKLTKEQADYLNAYWKKAEGNAEVAYKLRDALQGTIAPLNKTGFFNMGAVTLAESIPLMAAVSVPGLGPALVQQNYAYESENKLIQKNVPRAKAEVISQFIGAGQAALDMASLGLLKKAPGMQEVFAGLYALPIAAFTRSGVKEGAKIAAAALSNPLAQFAMRATGTTIFETGIEVAQDTLTEAVALQVGHWFDKTIPSTNWRDVWEEMKNTAPETLYSMMLMSSIGAGIATRADIKNIEYLAQDKEAMRLLGISETDMARVQFGSDPFAELQRSVKEAEQSSVRSTAPNVTIDNFSNPEQFYRVVVGDAAFQDIVDTGTVRTRTSDESVKEEGKVTLGGRPTAFPSFSKGTVSLSYAKANPNHYVIVADNDAGLAPSTHGRHGKGKTMFPTSADGQHLASMDAGKVSVYKHTGEGTYQLVWDKGPLTEQSSFATVQNDRTSINSPQTELTPAKARAVLKAVWKDRVVAEDEDSSFQGIGASYEWAQETLKKKAEIAARVAPITPTVDGFDVESPDGSGPVVVETKEEAEVLSVSFFEDQVLNPALNEEEKSVAAAEGRPDISSLDDGISQVGDIRKNHANPEFNVDNRISSETGTEEQNNSAQQERMDVLTREDNKMLDEAAGVRRARGDDGWGLRPVTTNPEGNGTIKSGVGFDGLAVANQMRDQLAIENLRAQQQELTDTYEKEKDAARQAQGLEKGSEVSEAVAPTQTGEIVPEPNQTNERQKQEQARQDGQGEVLTPLAEAPSTPAGEQNSPAGVSSEASQQTEAAPAEKPDGENPAPTVSEDEKLWAAKNAQTDAQRKRLGLEPRMEPMKRGWGMVWDLAMQKIADAAKDGRNLAAEILTDFRSSGRALDDLEVAVLTHELIIRETNYENLKASLKDAKTDTAKNEIASRILQLQRDNDELFAAVQETGTITARALAMRQMMIDDRFNIVRMRSELIAANGGRPLTKEQSAEVEAAKEKMDAIKEKQSLKTASILDNQVAELVAGFVEALKQASANIPPEKKKSALKSMAEAARKRNAERLSQVGSGGILFNPLYYIDNTIIIADWLATGAAKTLEGLKKFVQKEFGEDITEEQASKLKADADDIVASVGLTPAEKKTKAAKAKGKVDAEQDMEAAEGNGLPSKSLIYNAVQVKVQLGEKDPLKIMQAVHKDLLKDWPELTELQTKEIFSDYGKTSFPDQNELKRTMRDMRALVQQLAHIERMEKNLPLLKSGPQRDKASQQLREMRRRVGDMKKALGLNKKTDAQISSALDAAKTRLKNEIEDIEKYLKQPGGRTEAQKATKEGLKYDEEATALVKKRDELKGLLETLEGPKVLTFDQIVANTLKALEKTEEVLTRKVETGDVAVKQKQGAPVLTPEIEEKLSYIQTLRESIKESRDALNGNSAEISKEKAKAAAYIRARDEYNKRVAAGNYMPAGKQPTQTAMSKETAAAYDEMQKAKQAYLDLRKTRQADIDLTNDKKNTAKRIEKLKEKIAKGDFTTPSKKQRLEDKELMELKQEEWQVKKDWLTGVFAAKRAEWNNLQKLGNSTANFFGWARAWMTGLDLSALGRQAGFLLLARPIRTLKAFPIMMKASFSDAYAIAHETALYDPKQNPNAQLYRRDKLNITSPFATSLDKLEEEYRSQWLSSPPKWLDVLLKISVVGHLGQKLVRGSARAYTTVLNEIRTQSYDAMAATLTATGVPTEVEGKLIADVINTWTGRGKIPGLKKSEEVLTAMNTIFFAPRYVASRFQTLFMPVALVLREINTRFGNPLKLKDDAELAPIRRMLALEYLRFAAGYAALAGLYTLMQGTGDDDDKIEWDPRSSAFGKFKFGKTFVDPLAGLAQVATLTARLLTQQGKNPQGQVSDKNAWSVLQYFAETKLSPIAGAVRNLAAQQDLRGEETSLLGEMGRLLIPMALRDAVETYQTQQNVFGSAALVFLATCGYAVQNYQDDQKENIADDDYNWLYSQAVGIPKVTLKQQIGTIAGVDTKYDESLKKTLTSDQRKKLMELTLPEVNAAIKDLRQTFKDAPTDKDAWLEFRDEAQKEFNRQVRDIREAHIWEAIK